MAGIEADGASKVTPDKVNEFANALGNRDGLWVGRLMDEVGPCGWDQLFIQSKNVQLGDTSGDKWSPGQYASLATEGTGDNTKVTIWAKAITDQMLSMASREGTCHDAEKAASPEK